MRGGLVRDSMAGRRVEYHERSVEGKKRERSRKAMFQRMVRMLVLSKLVRFCRSMISSMRGCCHRPGVEAADEGCCVRVVVVGVLYVDCDCGVRVWTTFGRVVVEVGEGLSCCDGEGMRLLPEDVRVRVFTVDEERTSAVVDMVDRGRSRGFCR